MLCLPEHKAPRTLLGHSYLCLLVCFCIRQGAFARFCFHKKEQSAAGSLFSSLLRLAGLSAVHSCRLSSTWRIQQLYSTGCCVAANSCSLSLIFASPSIFGGCEIHTQLSHFSHAAYCPSPSPPCGACHPCSGKVLICFIFCMRSSTRPGGFALLCCLRTCKDGIIAGQRAPDNRCLGAPTCRQFGVQVPLHSLHGRKVQ